jgi:hypothetical protein
MIASAGGPAAKGGFVRTRLGWIVAGVAGVLLVAGGSFYGGVAYQRAQLASAQARFFADRGGRTGEGNFPGGLAGGGGFFNGGLGGAGQGGGARGVFGTVKSIDGDTILVSTPQDVTTVKLTQATVVQQMIAADSSALQAGQQISVRGDRDSSGVVTATSLQILGEPSTP